MIADAAAGGLRGPRTPQRTRSAFRVDWQPPRADSTSTPPSCSSPPRYRTTTSYDALNRVIGMRCPVDVEGGRRELVPLQPGRRTGAGDPRRRPVFVERIAYDAKGQRTLVAYGNGVMTRYAYDPRTFRLARLRTERSRGTDGLIVPAPSQRPVLQDLGYAYDLVGNILGDPRPDAGQRHRRQPRCRRDRRSGAAGAGARRRRPGPRASPSTRSTGWSRRPAANATARRRSPPWEDVTRCGFGSAAHARRPGQRPDLTRRLPQTLHYDDGRQRSPGCGTPAIGAAITRRVPAAWTAPTGCCRLASGERRSRLCRTTTRQPDPARRSRRHFDGTTATR